MSKPIAKVKNLSDGEAFDKVARMLKLGYPGGPAISREAAKWQAESPKLKAKSFEISLPRPMMKSNNFNFSFSGLKTAVLYLIKKIPPSQIKALKPQICFEFQKAVVDVLVAKTISAAKIYKPKTILLAGGVSANQELRKQMSEAIKQEFKNTTYILPDAAYSTDNAAMIAAAGFFRYQKMTADQRKKLADNWKNFAPSANLALTQR